LSKYFTISVNNLNISIKPVHLRITTPTNLLPDISKFQVLFHLKRKPISRISIKLFSKLTKIDKGLNLDCDLIEREFPKLASFWLVSRLLRNWPGIYEWTGPLAENYLDLNLNYCKWWLMFYGHFCAHGRLNGPSDLQR